MDPDELAIDPETGLADVGMPDEYVALCRHWHGGQDDLMYAVSSTGGLTLGSMVPYSDEADRFMTDQEWHVSLWGSLECDVRRAAQSARTGGHRDDDTLAQFALYCDEVGTALRTLYGLTDSEVV